METRTLSNPELLNVLENFELDDPEAALPFSKRLARDVGWSHRYALRVCDEYLRFLYLGMIAPHPLTPSEEVDQVWHLHLAYTRSYWDELCAKVLKRPFHHGPTKGGDREDKRYREQYEATLALYEREFGAKPPADIWPGTEQRFAAIRYSTFSPQLTFLARKPSKPVLFVSAALGALCGAFALGQHLSFSAALLVTLLPPTAILLYVAQDIEWATRSEYGTDGAGRGNSGSGCGGAAGCGSAGCGSGCGGGCGGS